MFPYAVSSHIGSLYVPALASPVRLSDLHESHRFSSPSRKQRHRHQQQMKAENDSDQSDEEYDSDSSDGKRDIPRLEKNADVDFLIRRIRFALSTFAWSRNRRWRSLQCLRRHSSPLRTSARDGFLRPTHLPSPPPRECYGFPSLSEGSLLSCSRTTCLRTIQLLRSRPAPCLRSSIVSRSLARPSTQSPSPGPLLT